MLGILVSGCMQTTEPASDANLRRATAASLAFPPYGQAKIPEQFGLRRRL
jgi:hypothetical protein